MGIFQSAVQKGFIRDADAEAISEKSFFTQRQVFKLASMFRKLNSNLNIDAKVFCEALDIDNHEIGEIIYKIIDTDGSGKLNFLEFVQGLNIFHPDAPFNEKVKMCFKAYDDDGSGMVSKDEILKVIKISLQKNDLVELDHAQVDKLADQLVREYSSRGQSQLCYDEFYNMVSQAPGVIECFDLDLDSLFGP